jgi:hypothetical protein
MRTLAEIAQLVFLKENPPDNKTYKPLPTQAQTIAMATSTHKNGSHSCPKSRKAPSPNAKNKQSKQQQTTTTTREKRPLTFNTSHIVEGTKRRRARGGGWTQGEAMD